MEGDSEEKELGGIRKLPEVVVNRIAAGEVIQRPANVVKELIENSLDAGATQIAVTVKGGGLKQILIQDNGHGIKEGDLSLLCERFATSKLRKYEDLLAIASYGFRGEALASVSHVSLLSVTTKTSDSPCAYKAEYIDGKLKGKPKACAGNQGTVIVVDDLFYNSQLRRNTMKSAHDEFSRIHEILSRYAIHNPSVGFSLKKHSENAVDLRTPPNSTVQGNIGIISGSALGKELLPFKCSNEALEYSASGYLSNPNFPVKKFVFILFINDRLVESSELKKAVELTYFGYLPKSSYPFVYLSLKIPPHRIDVNVHPTKQQVHFLNEGDIVQEVAEAVEAKLLACNQSRTFNTQAALPTIHSQVQRATGKVASTKVQSDNVDSSQKLLTDRRFSLTVEESQDMRRKSNSSQDVRPYDHELVRTDARLQRIDPFLTVRRPIQENSKHQAPPNQSEPGTSYPQQVNSPLFSDPIGSISAIYHHETGEPRSSLPADTKRCEPGTSADQQTGRASIPESYRNPASIGVEKENIPHTSEQNNVKTHFEPGNRKDGMSEKLFQPFVPPVKRSRPTEEEVMDEETSEASSSALEARKTEKEEKSEQSSLTIEQEMTLNISSQIVRGRDNLLQIEQFHYADACVAPKKWRDIELDSVNLLRRKVATNASVPLRQLMRKHFFVGCVDPGRALVQYDTGLFMLNVPRLSEELYYQAILFRFGNFGTVLLSEPAPIAELLQLSNTLPSGSDVEELTRSLSDKSELLEDYFSLKIRDRSIVGIPSVLSDHMPQLEGLPHLVEELCLRVNWEEESACLDGVSRALGRFCSLKAEYCQDKLYSGLRSDGLCWSTVVEQSLLPSFKAKLIPPLSFSQSGAIFKVTELQELYKVFERC